MFNINHEADRAMRLFLFEYGCATIGAGITEQASGQEYLNTASKPGKTEDRWRCEFRKEGINNVFYCGLSRVVIGYFRRDMLGSDVR